MKLSHRTLVGIVALFATLFTASAVWAERKPQKTEAEKLAASKDAETRGDLARAHGNYQTAALYFIEAVHYQPRNPGLYNKLGIAQLQARDHASARRSFKSALRVDPKNAPALNNLGAVDYLERKYKPAIGYLKQALALDESNASAHLNIAECWAGLGQMDRAMNEYARALELNADLLSGNQEGVVAQVRTPEQRARIAFLIAKAYAKRGNVEGALEYLKRAKDGGYKDLAKIYEDADFATVVQNPQIEKIVKRP